MRLRPGKTAVQRFGDLSMSSWAQAIDQNSGFVGMCK
jgi:hypothetical protein